MILFGAFSTMVQDHYVDTANDWAPTSGKKTTEKKKIKVAIWSSLPHPHLIICVLDLEKQKMENTDCNKLKDLEKVSGKWHGIE